MWRFRPICRCAKVYLGLAMRQMWGSVGELLLMGAQYFFDFLAKGEIK